MARRTCPGWVVRVGGTQGGSWSKRQSRAARTRACERAMGDGRAGEDGGVWVWAGGVGGAGTGRVEGRTDEKRASQQCDLRSKKQGDEPGGERC